MPEVKNLDLGQSYSLIYIQLASTHIGALIHKLVSHECHVKCAF